jgi:hypothetical protein
MKKLEYKINIISDLGIHALLFFIFLSVIFILYISKITEKTLKNELSHVIDDEIKHIIYKNKKLLVKHLDSKSYDRFKKKYNKEDQYKSLNNEWLKKSLLITNVLFFMIVTGSIFLMRYICNINIDIKEIVISNIYILLGITIFEYLLYKYIETKYMYTTPTLLLNTIINNSIKYFSH